jgi:hypothetical protein
MALPAIVTLRYCFDLCSNYIGIKEKVNLVSILLAKMFASVNMAYV